MGNGKKYNQHNDPYFEEDEYSDGIPYVNYKSPTTVSTVVSKPEPPKEIEIPKTRLKNLRTRYSKEENIVNDLLQAECREELFEYIDYISQEYIKCQKELDTLLNTLSRETHPVYSIMVGDKSYPLSYNDYDFTIRAASYKVFRIQIVPGSYLVLANNNTKQLFLPRFIQTSPVSNLFTITPEGVRYIGNDTRLFDIKVYLNYSNDTIEFLPTAGGINPFEVTRDSVNKLSKLIPEYTKISIAMNNVVSEILDKGVEINEELLPDLLVRWQKLVRIANYDIFGVYEKRVAKYGTSY